MLSAYVVKHEKTFVHTSPYSYFCMIRIYRNMKRILPVVSVILTLFGCQSLGFYGSYDYAFIGVSDYNMSDTARVENHNYEDSLISINWSINNGWGFDFALTNKTNGNIEIDWRKVSFISPCGYMSRSTVDFNSFIPPAATISQRLRWAKFSPMPMASLEAYNYNIWSTYKIIEIRPTYYIEIRDAWKSMLGKQFSVNPATITKPLRILEEKGYVSIVPKLGAFVISKGNTVITHTLGVICIRQNGEFDESEQRYLRSLYHYSPYTVSQIAAEIDSEAEQQGFHAILIHIGAEQLRQNPAYLTTLPVDGMIFIFSSLTYEIAEILKKKHIPFISTNACYSISEVNYIDFNMVQGIGDLLSLLLAQGYTRIAYFAPAGKYGFKQRIYNMFRKKLGNLFHEEFFVTGSDSSGEESTLENDPERISACAEKLLCGTKDVPEVILCNADLADLLETMITNLLLQKDCHGTSHSDLHSFCD